MKLTARFVQTAKAAPGKTYTDHKDDATSGLYLRVLAGGTRSWLYIYKMGGKQRRATLGNYPAMSLADARSTAMEWRLRIKDGIDPQALRDQQKAERLSMPTVAAFADMYIERYAKPNKRSWKQDRGHLDRDVLPAIGKLPMDQVHRRDVLAMVDTIRDRGAPVLANRALAVTRKMFNFAVERGVLETSPVTGIKATRETSRERILSDDELRQLWRATGTDSRMNPMTRLALRLLLLTATRAGEVCGMERGELDFGNALWTLPAARSKNKLTHTIPLSPEALSATQEALALAWSDRWVFPAARGDGHLTGFALNQAMERLFPVDNHPTPHDLRRTAATRMSEENNRVIVDKVLNHKDRSVGGIYDRYSYDREKRAALEAWAARLIRIVERRDNVVPLRA